MVYEIQLTGEISMSQKAKGHSDDKKSFTKLKESSKSFHIFSNFRKLLSGDKSMAPERTFEREYETLTVNVKL